MLNVEDNRLFTIADFKKTYWPALCEVDLSKKNKNIDLNKIQNLNIFSLMQVKSLDYFSIESQK